MKPASNRCTQTERDVLAGCYACTASWRSGNAQGSAARHHDQTGHPTWARVEMVVRYGADAPDLIPAEAPGVLQPRARPTAPPPRRRRRRRHHTEAR